ncbi:MAG: hypothetical protein AB1429_09700 [Pseudomonadota bacterium]|jgi:hypothetical protein
MRNFLKTAAVTLGVLLTAGAAVGAATAASADTGWWGYRHPRQEQVYDRLGYQNRRINREYREGEINRWQAYRLHRADARIARQDRFFARTNGGYITRGEQRYMNHEENRVSRRIGY